MPELCGNALLLGYDDPSESFRPYWYFSGGGNTSDRANYVQSKDRRDVAVWEDAPCSYPKNIICETTCERSHPWYLLAAGSSLTSESIMLDIFICPTQPRVPRRFLHAGGSCRSSNRRHAPACALCCALSLQEQH